MTVRESTDAARRVRWRDLVERRLPGAARPDWPVRLDHCFARILLDNACGGPWRARVAPPAHANMPAEDLDAAIALGEAVLDGTMDLALLNRRSLAWRGKLSIIPRRVPRFAVGNDAAEEGPEQAGVGEATRACSGPEAVR